MEPNDIFDRSQSREDIIWRLIAEGYTWPQAAASVAIAWGEISGDLEEVDENGNPIPARRLPLEVAE
mgnify:CR=1 FL=1